MASDIMVRVVTGASASGTVQLPAGSGNPTPGVRQNDTAGGKGLPPQSGGGAPNQAAALQQAVKHLQDYAQNLQRELHFSIDDQSGDTVIKVIDPSTHQVIRQIPSQEMLALSQHIAEEIDKGGLFKQKA